MVLVLVVPVSTVCGLSAGRPCLTVCDLSAGRPCLTVCGLSAKRVLLLTAAWCAFGTLMFKWIYRLSDRGTAASGGVTVAWDLSLIHI